jgi:hypothetical protein
MKRAMCRFPALVNGMQLTCALTLTVQQRFGGEEPAQWLAAFVNIAGIWKKKPGLIRDQQEDDQGWVWLS